MLLKSLPQEYDAKRMQVQLNKLYLRRSLLSDLIRKMERYHEWILRSEAPESTPRLRSRRAAA